MHLRHEGVERHVGGLRRKMTHAEAFFSGFDFGVDVAAEERGRVAASHSRAALLKLFENRGVEAAVAIIVIAAAAAAAGAFGGRFGRSQPLRH